MTPTLSQVDYYTVMDSLPIDRLAQRGLVGHPDWLVELDNIEKRLLGAGGVFLAQPPTRLHVIHARHDPNFIDMTGQRFGRLVVVGQKVDTRCRHQKGKKAPGWVVRCDCGTFCYAQRPALIKGRIQCCPLCFEYARAIATPYEQRAAMAEHGRKEKDQRLRDARLVVTGESPAMKRFMKRYGDPNA